MFYIQECIKIITIQFYLKKLLYLKLDILCIELKHVENAIDILSSVDYNPFKYSYTTKNYFSFKWIFQIKILQIFFQIKSVLSYYFLNLE